jgi:hypothetical protein
MILALGRPLSRVVRMSQPDAERRRTWKDVAIAAGVIVGVIALCLAAIVGSFAYKFRAQGKEWLRGPNSPAGHEVHVRVTDRAGWGADFYTDLRVTDPSGKELAAWKDPNGQNTWERVERLIKTMRWSTPTKLEFEDLFGMTYTVEVPNPPK